MMLADGNKRAAWRREGIAGGVRRRRGAKQPGGGGRTSRCVHAGLGATAARPGAAPVWLAALSAATCRTTGSGEAQAMRWDCVSGHAVYTNAGADIETIQPLGVSLEGGQTLSVCWAPGDTSYTFEVYGCEGLRQ